MTTPEEVTTQRFYLRKIEGAEVLLADETNFFRQELHKWAPVAPEPPPILEVSLSTRKPRPTKQQKMMQELGIDNPDDLPQKFRTKQHTFTKSRKSSDANSTKAPQPLQPAPQYGKRSELSHSPSTASPATMHGHRHPAAISTGESPYPYYHPIQSPQPHFNGQQSFSPTYGWSNRMADHNPSPGLSPGFGPHSPMSRSGPPLDPSLFSPSFPASVMRDGPGTNHNPSLSQGSMVSPMREHFGTSSHSQSAVDNLFADFTTDAGEEAGRNEAGEALEEREMDMRDEEEQERQLTDELFPGKS